MSPRPENQIWQGRPARFPSLLGWLKQRARRMGVGGVDADLSVLLTP